MSTPPVSLEEIWKQMISDVGGSAPTDSTLRALMLDFAQSINGTYVPLAAQNISWVNDYGADPTGTNDSTAAFLAAYNAMPATGQIGLGVGLYNVSSLPQFKVQQGIWGPGAVHCKVNYTGAGGTMLSCVPASVSLSNLGGVFSGFTLDGSLATGTPNGVQWSDMNRARWDDVTIQNFAGIGLLFENTTGNSEQASWRKIKLLFNGTQIQFNTGSFDYSDYEFHVTVNANQNGLSVINGATHYGSWFKMTGNFNNAASNTGTVVSIGNGNTDVSSFTQCQFLISVEPDGSNTNVNHKSLVINSAAAGGVFGCNGIWHMLSGSAGSFVAGSVTGGKFGLAGHVSDPTFKLPASGNESFQIQGGSSFTENGSITTAIYSPLYPSNGDVQSFLLSSGSNSFSSIDSGTTGSRPKRIDLFLAQPSSGGAGTMTWPGNIAWAGGVAPTLQTANNAVDHFRLTYLPSASTWYGEYLTSVATFPPVAPVAGSWYPNYAISLSTATPITGKLYAYPIIVTKLHTYQAIGAWCTAGGTAAVLRFGIYNDNGGTPVGGSLVTDFSTVTPSTAATASIAITQALSPGVYWLVVVQNSASSGCTVNADGSLRMSSLFGQIPGAAQSQSNGFGSTATTYTGALPTTFPAASVAGNTPMVLIEA